ncbi:hypothetical protein [Brevundimonas alba]
MNPTPLNPFRPTRWEHQRDGFQLIWFTKTAELLAAEKSVYVRGSRGSGKTTLLKSICWEDLSKNTSLRMQKSLSDFAHLGIYIRFPDHMSSAVSFSSWSEIYPDAPDPTLEFHRYFSLLVELTCAERALVACHDLRVNAFLEISPDQELALARGVLAEFPALQGFADEPPKTFSQVSRLMRTVVRRMNEAAGRGLIQELNQRLPGREPGELLAYVAAQLSASIRLITPLGRTQPAFKFCLDDCEVLSLLQQKSLNSLVRTSQFPVSWVVSSVGAFYDSTETFLGQQPLTDADRRVISLDDRGDEDFRELCQAVVSLRLLFSVSESVRTAHANKALADFFPLDARLGRRGVNDMMAVIAQRSASPMPKLLVSIAERFQALAKGAFGIVGAPSKSRPLPLYQTYLLLLWQGREDSFKVTFDAQDEAKLTAYESSYNTPAFQAWIRRKQRAALLHFAAALGFRRLPLGGAAAVVSLADGSIRDFLEILGEIYAAYAKDHRFDIRSTESLERFASSRTQIGWDTQTTGIYNASEAYIDGVSGRAERTADAVLRLLDGLGQLTSLLQSDPSDPTVLGRAERGIFSIRFSSPTRNYIGDAAPSREQAVWKAIRQAEIAGYIRTTEARSSDASKTTGEPDHHGRTISFRLHRRFAPHFRFSYRGAYEVVTIAATDLWALCDERVPVDAKAWATDMANRTPLSGLGQLPLQFYSDDPDA